LAGVPDEGDAVAGPGRDWFDDNFGLEFDVSHISCTYQTSWGDGYPDGFGDELGHPLVHTDRPSSQAGPDHGFLRESAQRRERPVLPDGTVNCGEDHIRLFKERQRRS
jgi:hypothetical protein